MNKWIDWVKQWAKKNNVKYGEALGNARCKEEYQKSKK
jgi:hypothetical protein